MQPTQSQVVKMTLGTYPREYLMEGDLQFAEDAPSTSISPPFTGWRVLFFAFLAQCESLGSGTPFDFARFRAVVKPSPFQSTSSLPCRPGLTFFGVRAKRSNLTWALNFLEAHTIQRIKFLAHWTYLRESPSFDMIPPLSARLKMEESRTEHGAH